MDKFTVSYVLVVSLAYLGWSSFKLYKAFGKRFAISWAIAMIVWFVFLPLVLFLALKLFDIHLIG